MIPAKWRPLKYVWAFLRCAQCLAFPILTSQMILTLVCISVAFVIRIPVRISLQPSKFWLLTLCSSGTIFCTPDTDKEALFTKCLYETCLLFSSPHPYEVDSLVFYTMKLRIQDRMWVTHDMMANKCRATSLVCGVLSVSLCPSPKFCPPSLFKKIFIWLSWILVAAFSVFISSLWHRGLLSSYGSWA